MLTMSEPVMAAFRANGLAAFKARLLVHWQEKLNAAGAAAGEDGRAWVLAQVDRMAAEDPAITEDQLAMLADLMLVDVANQRRRPPAGAAR